MTEDFDKDLQDLVGDLEDSEAPGEELSLDQAGAPADEESAPDEAPSGGEGDEITLETASSSDSGDGEASPSGGEGEDLQLDEELQAMLSQGAGSAASTEITLQEGGPGAEKAPPTPARSQGMKAVALPEDTVNLDFLLDIKLNVTFEVGRAKMLVSDLLTLGQGSVIELHRLVGDELDLLINGRLVAKGEVVVVNEKFGCRITDIIPPEERVKHMGGL